VQTIDIVRNAIVDIINLLILNIVIKIVAVDFMQKLIYENVCLAMVNVPLVIIFLFSKKNDKNFFFLLMLKAHHRMIVKHATHKPN